MSQAYNDNTKTSKPKENQLGILKIYILPENSAEDLKSFEKEGGRREGRRK